MQPLGLDYRYLGAKLSLSLIDRNIDRVRLIDDNPDVRGLYRYAVEDMDLNPDEIDGPLGDLPNFLKSFDHSRDAVISDFHLKSSNYSSFNGDELVMQLYKQHLPVVMCTRYADVLPEQVRARRRYIPVILKSDEINSDSLSHGFDLCAKEFAGIYLPSRRPWQAVVRVEGVERLAGNILRLNIVIPGWDLHTALSFDIPTTESNGALNYLANLNQHDEAISLFASVNLGAEKADDVYIDEWSLNPVP